MPDSTFSDASACMFCMAVWIKDCLSLLLSCSNPCPLSSQGGSGEFPKQSGLTVPGRYGLLHLNKQKCKAKKSIKSVRTGQPIPSHVHHLDSSTWGRHPMTFYGILDQHLYCFTFAAEKLVLFMHSKKWMLNVLNQVMSTRSTKSSWENVKSFTHMKCAICILMRRAYDSCNKWPFYSQANKHSLIWAKVDITLYFLTTL